MKKIISLILSGLLSFSMVAIPAAAQSDYPYPSLYRAYEDYFDISVAVEPDDLTIHPELAKNQFDVIVTENQMKPWIYKGENTWYWSGADKLVNYAIENNKKLRSHTLVCPDFFDDYASDELAWFYKDQDGNSLFDSSGKPVEGAKELTLTRLEKHIKTVVERYKGKIYAYDVVNEAFKESGALRSYTKFCRLLGENDDSWILKCFQWAHEADPNAVLIYNDNGFTSDIKKQNVIYKKIKEIRDAGIPVNIGMQMHYGADVRLDLVENLLERFSTLCDIYITELDMGLTSTVVTGSDTYDSTKYWSKAIRTYTYPEYMYDEATEIQARKYGSLFDLFRKYKDSVKCVGFWSLSDKTTYKNTATIPMVFDVAGEPKSAFYRILDFEQKLPRWEVSDQLPKYSAIDYTVDKETDTITVKGTTSGEAIVNAVLFNPGFKVGLSESDYINNEKTITANGEFEIEIPISYTQVFADPSYKLKLTIGNTVLYEDITYYSANHKEAGYKIYDELNDFTKLYSFYNMELFSSLTFYEDDECGVRYPNSQLKNRYIMYRVPDDRKISSVAVNAYVYETTLEQNPAPKPKISGSTDGVTFTALSDSSSWGDEIPKTLHTNIAAANQKRHFKCNLEVDPDSAIKYIKIDLEEFSSYWHAYIDDVEIDTVLDEDYAMSDKDKIIAGTPELFVHTTSKAIRTATLHNGTLSGCVEVSNHSDELKKIMYLMTQKQDGKLAAIKSDTAQLQAGESKTLSAVLEDCEISEASNIEMFTLDVTGGSLTPLIPKTSFEKISYPDMILQDDFENLDKMYSCSSTIKTFDASATKWSFKDTTLLHQSADWKGGAIVYKAEDEQVFKEVMAVIYTNITEPSKNISNYGTPYISVSNDGETFTTVLGGKSANTTLEEAGWLKTGKAGCVANTHGDWFAKRVATVEIPDGAKYVKLGFPGSLFSQYHIKLGGIMLRSFNQAE